MAVRSNAGQAQVKVARQSHTPQPSNGLAPLKGLQCLPLGYHLLLCTTAISASSCQHSSAR